ncbi:putative 60S ribosomal protein L37a-1 [Momordica charantia]|uniref:60S ribosomal protein L37a-1 n=1 Tax=Momordica charantia TaxID=3673 RepID=A0A6J1DT19_MOMCH|nr:putative 60S ribosomal protein L37a-1 [Momordica charantia]
MAKSSAGTVLLAFVALSFLIFFLRYTILMQFYAFINAPHPHPRAKTSFDLFYRTKKASIVGKYGTRYGASLRKQIKKMEVSHHRKYFCEFSEKYAVKRKVVGIWGCKDCGQVKADSDYTLNTASAGIVRSTIRRLRERTES